MTEDAAAAGAGGGHTAGGPIAGRYVTGERLGAGAVGVVHAGWDEQLARPVALKFLHPHLADDEPSVTRFCREARTLAQLTHPNIVQVFDFVEDADPPCIVIELVDGVTLRELLDTSTTPLADQDWRALSGQLLEGLAAAHDAGIIHRDLKPQNVLVERSGRLRIADFGLARVDELNTITEHGATMGTALYMAPEQARGDRVDQRSDLYSAGAVIYELATGAPPFTGANALEVAMRHLNDAVADPRTSRTDIPARLAESILSMLAKDPNDRPASAREALKTLESEEEEEDSAVTTVTKHDPAATLTQELTQTLQAREPLGATTQSVPTPADANVYGGFAPAAHPNVGRVSLRERAQRSKTAVAVRTGRSRSAVAEHAGRSKAAMATGAQRVGPARALDGLKILVTAALVAATTALVVQSAPERHYAPVPDVLGLTRAEAAATAVDHGRGLELSFERSNQPSGTVIRQEPSPGSRSRPREALRAWVSR